MDHSAQVSKQFIYTQIGEIAVYLKVVSSAETPLIFLHGVYFDHHLWDAQVKEITDRTIILVDMPYHGNSRENIKKNWSLTDCSIMLMDILNHLKIPKVIAVGHSWGSMTILRAAHNYPDRFVSIGLCNMPFQAASRKQKALFSLQHALLVFRSFYVEQTAKALFGKKSLKENPSLTNQLIRPMSILSSSQIKHTDRAVILNAEDTTDYIKTIKVYTLALKGEDDYVPGPPLMETIIVAGGHISPLENPKAVMDLIQRLMHGQK